MYLYTMVEKPQTAITQATRNLRTKASRYGKLLDAQQALHEAVLDAHDAGMSYGEIAKIVTDRSGREWSRQNAYWIVHNSKAAQDG